MGDITVKVPKSMQEKYDEISKHIIEFCDKYLNEEYKVICCELCGALARKRPSPLVTGKAGSWACGIIHAIGTVNFLFDQTQTPHIKPHEIYDWFGYSQSTSATKAKKIKDIMNITYFDPKWTLPSIDRPHPIYWYFK